MKRAKIILRDGVQNVALRVSVKAKADKLGLRGQVMNLKDGTVTAICEGEQDSIEQLIGGLRNTVGLASVNSVSVSYSEPTDEYDSFSVIYGEMTEELVTITLAGVMHMERMCNEMQGVNNRLDVMENTNRKGFEDIKEEVRGVKEEVRGVNNRLDVMENTNRKGFEDIKEEVRGVNNRLDKTDDAIREGLRSGAHRDDPLTAVDEQRRYR